MDRDAHVINSLKKLTVKELDNEEMASRLFQNMMNHGGPGSIGVAERPFYHSQDYIWRYFTELAAALESKLVRYKALLEDLERQIVTLVGNGRGVTDAMSPQRIHYSFSLFK